MDLSTIADITVRYFPETVRIAPTWVAQGRPQGFDFYLTGFGKDANTAVEDLHNNMKNFFEPKQNEEETE